MSRHVLTLREQLNGIRAALRSPRTPAHLRVFLRQRRSALLEQLGRGRKRRAEPKRAPGLLDWPGKKPSADHLHEDAMGEIT